MIDRYFCWHAIKITQMSHWFERLFIYPRVMCRQILSNLDAISFFFCGFFLWNVFGIRYHGLWLEYNLGHKQFFAPCHVQAPVSMSTFICIGELIWLHVSWYVSWSWMTFMRGPLNMPAGNLWVSIQIIFQLMLIYDDLPMDKFFFHLLFLVLGNFSNLKTMLIWAPLSN